MFSLGLLLLRLLSALPGPWLDLSDQVLAASGADAVRFSPVITLYIGREDGCTIGWEPAGRRFYRGWDGGKAMKEKEKTCKTIGCGRTFISSGRRLYCYTCRPAVLPNGASGDTPKIGKKRDSNAISPLTSDASAKASKASFFYIFGISDSVSDIDSFLSLEKEEILRCLSVATEAHLDLLDEITGIRTGLTTFPVWKGRSVLPCRNMISSPVT